MEQKLGGGPFRGGAGESSVLLREQKASWGGGVIAPLRLSPTPEQRCRDGRFGEH